MRDFIKNEFMYKQQAESRLKRLARNLRRDQTSAEKILWFHLRDRKFQNLKFRRQFAIGNYIVDFCCLEKKLIIELDGMFHADQYHQDITRESDLVKQGYIVIRFWNGEVTKNLDGILLEIQKHVS